MIAGLSVTADLISVAEESELVAVIGDDMPAAGSSCGRSRIDRYGPGVPASGYVRGHRIELAMPGWLAAVAERVGRRERFMPNAITVAWYQKGDSVRPHLDRKECGEVIAVLSLLGVAEMRFLPPSLDASLAVSTLVMPRSLVVMRGDARWNWLHEISPVTGPRIALVFRESTL